MLKRAILKLAISIFSVQICTINICKVYCALLDIGIPLLGRILSFLTQGSLKSHLMQQKYALSFLDLLLSLVFYQ